MNIFSKWFQKPRSPEPEISVQVVPSNSLLLSQWRGNDKLVAAAMQLERDTTYQMQLQVLKNVHPMLFHFADVNVRQEDRAAHQAKIEGYQLCLNNLASFSKKTAIAKPLQATFSPPESPTK